MYRILVKYLKNLKKLLGNLSGLKESQEVQNKKILRNREQP